MFTTAKREASATFRATGPLSVMYLFSNGNMERLIKIVPVDFLKHIYHLPEGNLLKKEN